MRDDELLRRYLLGDLPEGETEGMEQRLLREDSLSELAEAIESEVLEDYARGSLSPAQQDHVKRFLASSPSGRLRLAIVRGLGTLSHGTGTIAAMPDNVRPFPRPDLSRPWQRFAAIAAMLVLAVVSFMLATIPPPIQPQTAGVPVVLQLALSALRDDQQKVQELSLPAGRSAELRIPLRDRDQGHASYQVVLEDGTGEEAHRWENLQARPVGGHPALVLLIKSGQLPEGRYTARIRGVDPGRVAADLAFQEFHVHRPNLVK